jgi:hypothetical protein
MPRKKDLGLILINLRLRKKDVAQAKRLAKERNIPYQHVIRTWVASAAEGARP